MNLQSQQTCPNPSVCVIFSCQGWCVGSLRCLSTHTHRHLLAEHLCTTFACGWDLKHRRGESLSQDFVSGKNRAAIWFCLAQTDCNLTLICSCAALSPQKRERERRTGIKGKEENGLYTFHQTKTRTDGQLFQMLLIQQDLDTVSAGLLCVCRR